jgi:hypothetical protein
MPPLPGMPPMPGGKAAAAAPAKPTVQAPVQRTKEEYLAKAAMEYWMDNLFGLARSDGAVSTIGIDHDLLNELVVELTGAARRVGLETTIAKDIGRIAGNANEPLPTLLEKAGFCATSRINRFVNTLGFDALPEEKRPKAPNELGETLPVYGARPVNSDCSTLPDAKTNFAYQALSQWMYSFYQVVEDNVLAGGGVQVDVEQNERLKREIDRVDNALGGLARQAA